METENRPQLKAGGHNMTQLIHHMTICPKYRAPILHEPAARLIIAGIRRVCSRHGIKIIQVGTDKDKRDHIHIQFQSSPSLSISDIARLIKGGSSYYTRVNLPCLRLWCEGHLWSAGYFCETVGANWQVHKKYIKRQGA